MLDVVYRYFSIQALIAFIPILPLVGALINGFISTLTAAKEDPGPRSLVSFVGSFAAFFSFASISILFFTLIGFDVGAPSVITGPLLRWAVLDNLSIDMGFKVDQLSMIFSMIIGGLGFLVQIYSIGFMSRARDYSRYVALIGLFIFFMQIVVLSDNLLFMFMGWEGVGICTYFLIGFWFKGKDFAPSAMRFFVMDRIGSAALLAAIFLIFGVMSAAGVSGNIFNFDPMSSYGAYFLPVSGWLSGLLLVGGLWHLRHGETKFCVCTLSGRSAGGCRDRCRYSYPSCYDGVGRK